MYWRVMYRDGLMAVVLVAMAVTLASSIMTPTYEASAQVWVDQKQNDRQTYLTGRGEEIQTLPPDRQGLQAIILTMEHTIDTRPVAEETIRRLGLQAKLEPAELLNNLTVEPVENTSFIGLTYEGTDPQKATKIVDTVGEVASELISETSIAGSQLTVPVFEKAVVPESPVSPDPLRNGLLTLVIGLLLRAVYLVRMGSETREPGNGGNRGGGGMAPD